MGTWGTSLYENDLAKDIRADYLELLSLGKSDEDALKELLAANIDVMGDDDEALFWLALADTQWDYGRLQANVKEKALLMISGVKDDRWHDESSFKEAAWNETIYTLKNKLLKKQPRRGKIPKRKYFHCQWPLGSVFAYCFYSEYSREKGFYQKYVVFRKVSEDVWYPKHIVPVVTFYRWVGNYLPSIENVKHMEKLPVYSPKETARRRKIGSNIYHMNLIAESGEELPEEYLHYLGNMEGEDLTKFQGFDCWTGNNVAGWESGKGNWKIEKKIINLLLEWGVELGR